MPGMQFHRRTLPNGIRIITVPMLSIESVTVLVMVGAGSRYENKANSGISHFLEHMAFKGTTKRPTALSISTLIDGIGGECNAFTGKEVTGYYIKSAAAHVELSVDVLSDMLQNSLFDQAEINKEKGVILEEINLYEDTPARKIGDVFERLLYGDVPMGWDISGEKDVIKKTTRVDFVRYLDSLYSADRITVVISGGVEVKKAEELVIKYFGKMKKFKTDPYAPVIPSDPSLSLRAHSINSVRGNLPNLEDPHVGRSLLPPQDDKRDARVLIKHKKTEQVHIALGVKTVAINNPDRYPLSVLSAILGGGMSSRLFHEVREKRGLGYYVRSHSEEYQDTGYFCSTAGVDPKRIDEAITVILEQYQQVAGGTLHVADSELKKAKEYMKGHFILDMEDSRSVAGFYATQELLEDHIDNMEDILVKIDKVTKDDVLRVAQTYLTKPMQLAIIGDFEDKDHFQKLLEA